MMWPRWYSPPTTQLPARRIVEQVAAAFALTPDELRQPCRRRERVIARGVAARLLRDCQRNGQARYSQAQIAGMLGYTDHTTVVHALKNFPVWQKHYPDVAGIYTDLKALAA